MSTLTWSHTDEVTEGMARAHAYRAASPARQALLDAALGLFDQATVRLDALEIRGQPVLLESEAEVTALWEERGRTDLDYLRAVLFVALACDDTSLGVFP